MVLQSGESMVQEVTQSRAIKVISRVSDRANDGKCGLLSDGTMNDDVAALPRSPSRSRSAVQ